MVSATSAFTDASSLTSAIVLATELAPCSRASDAATSLPSAMSAIISRAPSRANART